MRSAESLSDDELRSAYQRSSVALFALTDATASNAVLEALASGLPIAATDVGGIRDYLDDESAVLCPVGDGRALGDAIGVLLADPAEAERRARAARERSLRFDYRFVARELAKVYALLLPLSRG
jgi:glycogen(starch) synthase